jgi:endoglucanase
MWRVRRTLIALSAAGLFAGILTPAGAVTPLAGPFHTLGNQILDVNNHPVRFRGVVTGMLNWYPYINTSNTQDVTDASFNAARAWGVNAVRVPLGEQYWLQSYGCQYPITAAAYQNNVATIVNRITSRGMLAVLDLHWNTKFTTSLCNSAKQQRMADAAHAITFWQQVATRFKNDPMVAFDLYNEPYGITWGVWKYGGMVYDGGAWRATGMQQMYDAVRGTGAKNLVFVTGNGWGNTPPPNDALISGYNIVYAAHYYTCPNNPPPLGDCRINPYNPAPPGQRLDSWTPLSLTQPVVVTEFGWPNQDSGVYNQNVINWAESRGIGWMAFTWNPDRRFGLITNLTTFAPTPAGIPVKNGVALNP